MIVMTATKRPFFLSFKFRRVRLRNFSFGRASNVDFHLVLFCISIHSEFFPAFPGTTEVIDYGQNEKHDTNHDPIYHVLSFLLLVTCIRLIGLECQRASCGSGTVLKCGVVYRDLRSLCETKVMFAEKRRRDI